MQRFMLTTIDNPFNPFEDYDEWWSYDDSHGYHTPSFLARIVVSSDDLSDTQQVVAINQAIDEIISENVLGLYIKVTQEIKEN